jgi:hypothetical protein
MQIEKLWESENYFMDAMFFLTDNRYEGVEYFSYFRTTDFDHGTESSLISFQIPNQEKKIEYIMVSKKFGTYNPRGLIRSKYALLQSTISEVKEVLRNCLIEESQDNEKQKTKLSFEYNNINIPLSRVSCLPKNALEGEIDYTDGLRDNMISPFEETGKTKIEDTEEK